MEPTMNFNFGGWKSSKAVYSHASIKRLALHLFGHALGLPHAKLNQWPLSWKEVELKLECDSFNAELLRDAKGCDQLRDPESIMYYDVPARLVNNKAEIRQGGCFIDQEARSLVQSLYPKVLEASFFQCDTSDFSKESIAEHFFRTSCTANIVTGIRKVDMGINANFRLKSEVSNVDSVGYTVKMGTWNETCLNAAICNVLSFEPADKRVQTGSARWDSLTGGNGRWTRQTFGKAFNQTPNVVVFISAFDTEERKVVRIDVAPSDIDKNGFTVHMKTWNGKTQSNSFFFDYSILDLQDGATTSKSQSTTAAADTDKLDSQCWSSNAKRLQFSSEVRVVGEDAIPVYQIPAVDRSYRKVIRSQSQKQKLDQWLSSSLCLMNQKVFDFQVLSDGRYIYVFRQSASAEAEWPNQFMSESHDGKPPVDNNLLCDRFALVGSTLSQPLETRYQRSRQEQIPLNEQDTLRVKDINDEPFYEPTHSLRFVQDLVDGRFCVLRAPTVTNNVTKWMIFAYSCIMGQIECLTTDVASNGLFDLHGHVYYTCDSDTHPTTKVFANGPGPCTAAKDDGSGTCSKARVPIMPKTPASKRAVQLSGDAGLQLRKPVDLSSLLDGFTLEAWVKPESADNGTEEATEDSSFSVFRVSDNSPGTFINEELRLTIQLVGEKKAIVTSETALKADEWNHIAVTYNPTTSTYGLAINGAAAGSAISSNPPGSFLGIGLQPKGPTSYFTGLFDEIKGGLCATVYNEQVAVSEKKTTDSEGGSSSKQKSGDGAQPKHMKRGARVLLCFISGTDASPLRLAALDFGLLSDGTLADTPALMNPQALTAASSNSSSAKVGTVGLKVPTALLYVGGEGMEIFGGVVALDAVGCVPSKLEELCSLINGTKLATTRTIGHVAQLVGITTNGYAAMETPPTEIALLDVLTNSVTAGTFLSIETEREPAW
ncbi:hypothetical protein K4K56_000075 [Colletotrichum sp. SAR 10_98]|nr:hypothetical protein K4K56_000075 [Colletotrichum sp. SAR 10_98]